MLSSVLLALPTIGVYIVSRDCAISFLITVRVAVKRFACSRTHTPSVNSCREIITATCDDFISPTKGALAKAREKTRELVSEQFRAIESSSAQLLKATDAPSPGRGKKQQAQVVMF